MGQRWRLLRTGPGMSHMVRKREPLSSGPVNPTRASSGGHRQPGFVSVMSLKFTLGLCLPTPGRKVAFTYVSPARFLLQAPG